jgi:biotin carboxyl carrier protein
MNDFIVRINGTLDQVKIIDEKFIEINNKRIQYKLVALNYPNFILKIENKVYNISYWKNSNDEITIQLNNQNFDANIRTVLQEKAFQLISASQQNVSEVKSIKSPMPGLVLKILRNVGDDISKGDTIMILEAMKMENEIKSTVDGIIEEIYVTEGQAIEKYISLFSIK